MYRILVGSSLVLVAVLFGDHSAFAHYPSAAPAPLLAAGIPAFAARGGGVVVTRIVRRFRRRD